MEYILLWGRSFHWWINSCWVLICAWVIRLMVVHKQQAVVILRPSSTISLIVMFRWLQSHWCLVLHVNDLLLPSPCTIWRDCKCSLLHHSHICRHFISFMIAAKFLITSPPEGVARYCFHPVCLSVCLCFCVCVSVCPANILVFYFSAIRRDIDLKFIQDTYRVVLNSLTKNWPS